MENNIDLSNKKRGLGRGLGSLLGGGPPTSQVGEGSADKTVHPTIDISGPMNTHRLNTQGIDAHIPSNQRSDGVGLGFKGPHQVEASRQAPAVPDHARIWNIPIEKIVPGAHQPRKAFEKAHLEELAQSIREHGVLQPLLVRRRSDGKYELIAGERRWRASQLAGLLDLPAIVKNFEDRQSAEVALIENIQREDLNPIEEAQALQRLVKDFGLTQQELAARIGKERATIANSLRLLSLPTEVLEMVAQRQISSGHAKVLLSLEEAETQVELSRQIQEKKLSVRQLEALVKKAQKGKLHSSRLDGVEKISDDMPARLAASLAEELQKRLGTKVQIDYSQGKGKISLHFFSDEELTRLYEKLK